MFPGCDPLFKSRYLLPVLEVESLGWWDGVKATIKLSPLSFLEVYTVIIFLVTLAKSPILNFLAGLSFAWLLAAI